ncbi:MAG: hypothetical protein KC466_12720 [Myxococcales bacterium]|nr:hypothetical protein [Myxococcales bacterium]
MDPRNKEREPGANVIAFPRKKRPVDDRDAVQGSPGDPDLAAGQAWPVEIERWGWTGREDFFVVKGRPLGASRALWFVTALTASVREAIERREPCDFRIHAHALQFRPAPILESARMGGSRDADEIEAWADDALRGDPIARRLIARAAERFARLAERNGPRHLLVRLASMGERVDGPFADAVYLARGPVEGLEDPPGLGEGGLVRRGTMDTGVFRFPIEIPERVAAGAALGAPGETMEADVVLIGRR